MKHTELNWPASDGLPLFAQSWEPEGSPKAVLCLVHGLGEHTGRYAHVARALTAAGYAIVGSDLRGHGKSEGQRGHTPSYDMLLADIGLLMDQTATRYGDPPRFLYGHSLGGNLVLNSALRRAKTLSGGATRPDDTRPAGVIATSPWLGLAFAPPPWKHGLARLMDRLWPAFSTPSGLETTGLSRDPKIAQAYLADPLVHDRVSARLGASLIEAGNWAVERASELDLPLLLMHGTADRLTSAPTSQRFADRADGSVTLKLWDGFFHELHNEPEQEDVIAFMIDWLHDHTPA